MSSDNPLEPLGLGAAEWRRIRAAIEASDRYALVERFEPRAQYAESDGRSLRTALMLDVETTGLVAGRDRIIQLAIVPFTFDRDTGQLCAVEPCQSWYEDPGVPIPEAVTQLTGITDADVAGKRIDDAAVAALLARSALVIAHNAGFDRAFCEARLPAFEASWWACSQRDVPWLAEGLQSARLEWLAYKHAGLFYEAHRADIDCGIAVHLLSTTLPLSGAVAMQALLAAARRREARVWAVNSAFDTKDRLKARGYRWSSGDDGGTKGWYRDVDAADVDGERAWLAAEVYGSGGRPLVVPFDGRVRYSPRLMRAP